MKKKRDSLGTQTIKSVLTEHKVANAVEVGPGQMQQSNASTSYSAHNSAHIFAPSSNFVCCGSYLPDLASLVAHYEQVHEDTAKLQQLMMSCVGAHMTGVVAPSQVQLEDDAAGTLLGFGEKAASLNNQHLPTNPIHVHHQHSASLDLLHQYPGPPIHHQSSASSNANFSGIFFGASMAPSPPPMSMLTPSLMFYNNNNGTNNAPQPMMNGFLPYSISPLYRLSPSPPNNEAGSNDASTAPVNGTASSSSSASATPLHKLLFQGDLTNGAFISPSKHSKDPVNHVNHHAAASLLTEHQSFMASLAPGSPDFGWGVQSQQAQITKSVRNQANLVNDGQELPVANTTANTINNNPSYPWQWIDPGQNYQFQAQPVAQPSSFYYGLVSGGYATPVTTTIMDDYYNTQMQQLLLAGTAQPQQSTNVIDPSAQLQLLCSILNNSNHSSGTSSTTIQSTQASKLPSSSGVESMTHSNNKTNPAILNQGKRRKDHQFIEPVHQAIAKKRRQAPPGNTSIRVAGLQATVNRASPFPFKCPVPACPKSYKNANGLKYHARHAHRPDEQPVLRPYKCHICLSSGNTMGVSTSASTLGNIIAEYKNSNGLKYHMAHVHGIGKKRPSLKKEADENAAIDEDEEHGVITTTMITTNITSSDASNEEEEEGGDLEESTHTELLLPL